MIVKIQVFFSIKRLWTRQIPIQKQEPENMEKLNRRRSELLLMQECVGGKKNKDEKFRDVGSTVSDLV